MVIIAGTFIMLPIYSHTCILIFFFWSSGHVYIDTYSEYYQIYIKVISGKTLALQVHKDFTIDDLKKNIEVREIVPADMQHIIYAGKQLLNGHTITHYSIHAGSTLHMSFYLRGGSTETIPGRKLFGCLSCCLYLTLFFERKLLIYIYLHVANILI